MSSRKTKVKIKKTKVPKIGWTEGNKNIKTLRNLEKVIQEEKELKNNKR